MSSNLESEIKSYNNLFKQHDMALSTLNQFFKAMSINGIKFAERSKKSLEEFFIELKNENSLATHIVWLSNFNKNFKNTNTESINNFYKLNTKLKEETSNLEKVKFDYFNANKVTDQDYLKTQNETKSKEEIKKNKLRKKLQNFRRNERKIFFKNKWFQRKFI